VEATQATLDLEYQSDVRSWILKKYAAFVTAIFCRMYNNNMVAE
jgi:hypothetical protein